MLETHITVAAMPWERIDELHLWAAAHELKCLCIILDRGLVALQPMLTWRGAVSLDLAVQEATRISRELQLAGYELVRIKIESAADHPDAPQSHAEARDQPEGRYFEHHFKLILPAETDLAALVALGEKHGARLSRNAFRVCEDETDERFMTQRCSAMDFHAAGQRLQSLQASLNASGYTVAMVVAEYVLYDSNLALDAGWIEEGFHDGNLEKASQ